ncbi:hypothetical protein [Pseudoalteromonas piscicida]|uniref:hypothetical protein n=1 Tax=Pseudoalteromonas piscicida TaxID=43662 RepID=UPI0030B7636C
MKLTLWAYAARFTGLASSMLILPFGLHYLPAEQFSIWMIFIAVYGLIIVFDFGLSLTFSRKVNYVYSSVENSEASSQKVDETSKEEYSRVYNASVTVFSIISIIAVLVLTVFYFFYFPSIENKLGYSICLEWFLFVLAIAVQLICLIYNVVYFGLNKNLIYYKCLSLSNFIFMLSAVSFFYFDFKLLSISLGRFISSAVLIIMLVMLVEKTCHKKLYVKNKKFFEWGYIRSLLPASMSLGGVSLSNYLSNKSAVFFVSSYFPLDEAARFSLTHNIFSIITSVSLIFMTAHNPKVNMYYKSGKFVELISMQNKIRLVSLFFSIPAILVLVVFGDVILNVLGSETKLLPFSLVALFYLYSVLDINRNVSQYFIMSSDNVPFLKSSIISATFIVLLNFIFYDLGFKYIVLSIAIPLVVQLSFNFWFWTYQEVKLRRKVSCAE